MRVGSETAGDKGSGRHGSGPFFLGKSGRIRMRQVGTLAEERLRWVVPTLLAEEATGAGEGE